MKNYKYPNKKEGILYVVPTPIGNLSDITYRALSILNSVDIIAAENINRTKILIQNYKIIKKIISINKHNEKSKSKKLIIKLKKGINIALVSNAGTPTINDPGQILINYCYHFKIKIIPLPGPCSAITALSISGLSTNKFCYEGFLPSKSTMRCKLLHNLRKEQRTIIVFETPHRIIDSVNDIVQKLGSNRNIVLTKELTKKWECIRRDTSFNILLWLKSNYIKIKGEITIIIEGYQIDKTDIIPNKALKTLQILKSHLPLKKAIQITTHLHKISKNLLYKHAMLKKY
ncbi:MAG: 16S rRNA (cytidine(1402)-2'-O)-methyltransferase [Buchnera aphidicola (Schlechtendalia peitan)]